MHETDDQTISNTATAVDIPCPTRLPDSDLLNWREVISERLKHSMIEVEETGCTIRILSTEKLRVQNGRLEFRFIDLTPSLNFTLCLGNMLDADKTRQYLA